MVPCFPLLGLTPSGLFMGLSSTLIYTSELILFSTICVPSATRHNIHTLVNSQLVCLPPAGILNLGMLFEIFIIIVCYIGPEKPQWGLASYVYVFYTFFYLREKNSYFLPVSIKPQQTIYHSGIVHIAGKLLIGSSNFSNVKAVANEGTLLQKHCCS